MTLHRAFGIRVTVCILAVTLSYHPLVDGKTIDQSDLWWVPTEAGWGMQLVQQDNIIFATLFIYGPDGQPTWYTATLSYEGSLVWSGLLIRTTGPSIDADPLLPALTTFTPVGSMTLSMPLINQGTLIYTVNGVQVTKTIERQLMVYENFGTTPGIGNTSGFVGVMSQQGYGLYCDPAANTNATPVTVQITQSTPAMTMVIGSSRDTCSFTGTYDQAGHFGRFEGNYYSCTSGDTGTFSFIEMARSWYEFRARTSLVSKSGCTLKGFLIGLEQPPPTQ
jgi:hypothetical protein